MPLVGFEMYLDADDEFAYRPMAGKPDTYLFFCPSAEQSQPYFATFWLDPCGLMLEAVCHYDRN